MTIKRYSDYFKPNLFSIIVLIFILALIVYMAIKNELTLAIVLLGILISIFYADRSLRIANKSLELSRASMRPFIYIQNNLSTISLSKDDAKFEFIMKNTGVLPGEIISVEFTFFRKGEIITFENTSAFHTMRHPPINFDCLLFPGNSTTAALVVEGSYPKYKQFEYDYDNDRLVIRSRILYKKDNIEYETIQTALLRKQGQKFMAFIHSAPQRWT